MIWTNKHNLPEPLAQAVKNDPYRLEGDISVTGLIRPPQMAQLEREHEAEIEVDVADRIYALLGQSVHSILERSYAKGIAQEKRLSVQVLGWTVTGKSDLIHFNGLLQDYKVTSVYSFLLGDKPEWEAQLNCYAEIARQHGHPVSRLEIVAILRDWMNSRAKYDPNYPPAPALVSKVNMWSRKRTCKYLYERVRLHQKARGGHYPDCTPEERWERPTKWAVIKPGNKRAKRIFYSYDEAVKYCDYNNLEYDWITERPGASVRCEGYCPVSKWCDQFNKEE